MTDLKPTLSHKRTLVTGGAGFIGSHLVEHLVALGAQVTVIDKLNTGYRENLQAVEQRINFVHADLGNLLLRAAEDDGGMNLADYDYIFHLAANPYIPPSVENPVMDFETNLLNSFLLLESLRGLPAARPRLINVSSAAVYGNPARLPIHESDPTVPISPYGVSKLAAERYVAVYSQLYGLWAVSMRFFSVYGPRQHKQVVFDLFRKLRANPARLEILGDGSQARDFAYVGDVARAMTLAATAAPGQGEVYNVASGMTHTIAELAAACCRACRLEPEMIYSGQTRPGDADKWMVDVSRLQQMGFVPQVSLEAGLAAVQEWYDGV
jgi:UDP-glucose 4-epimerase